MGTNVKRRAAAFFLMLVMAVSLFPISSVFAVGDPPETPAPITEVESAPENGNPPGAGDGYAAAPGAETAAPEETAPEASPAPDNEAEETPAAAEPAGRPRRAPASGTAVTVNSLAEFEAAINDATCSAIVIGSEIRLKRTYEIDREVTIALPASDWLYNDNDDGDPGTDMFRVKSGGRLTLWLDCFRLMSDFSGRSREFIKACFFHKTHRFLPLYVLGNRSKALLLLIISNAQICRPLQDFALRKQV